MSNEKELFFKEDSNYGMTSEERIKRDSMRESLKKNNLLKTGISEDIDYAPLSKVLTEAYNQASQGKGKERHANSKPFNRQPICEIGRMVGIGYNLGQAMKKTQESQTLLKIKGKEAAKAELLGAIVYLASAVNLIEEMEIVNEQTES